MTALVRFPEEEKDQRLCNMKKGLCTVYNLSPALGSNSLAEAPIQISNVLASIVSTWTSDDQPIKNPKLELRLFGGDGGCMVMLSLLNIIQGN